MKQWMKISSQAKLKKMRYDDEKTSIQFNCEFHFSFCLTALPRLETDPKTIAQLMSRDAGGFWPQIRFMGWKRLAGCVNYEFVLNWPLFSIIFADRHFNRDLWSSLNYDISILLKNCFEKISGRMEYLIRNQRDFRHNEWIHNTGRSFQMIWIRNKLREKFHQNI